MVSDHALENLERFIKEAETHEREHLDALIHDSHAVQESLDELYRDILLFAGYLRTLDASKGNGNLMNKRARARYGGNFFGFGSVKGPRLINKIHSAYDALEQHINHDDPSAHFVHKQVLEQLKRMIKELDIIWQQHERRLGFAT